MSHFQDKHILDCLEIMDNSDDEEYVVRGEYKEPSKKVVVANLCSCCECKKDIEKPEYTFVNSKTCEFMCIDCWSSIPLQDDFDNFIKALTEQHKQAYLKKIFSHPLITDLTETSASQ